MSRFTMRSTYSFTAAKTIAIAAMIPTSQNNSFRGLFCDWIWGGGAVIVWDTYLSFDSEHAQAASRRTQRALRLLITDMHAYSARLA